jgi:anaerobic selenocysteine-containing dehydrogenase
MMNQEVLGACPHDCPDTCALMTTVSEGRAIKVEGNPSHALTAGVLCHKVSRYPERTYHSERLLQPLRRIGPKGSGQFAPVSWDAALDEIATKLTHIAQTSAHHILPYSYAGTMGVVQGEGMASRFFNTLGASRLDRTICASAGGEALTHTLGGKVGMHMPYFAESKIIVIWGSNPIVSNLHFWRIAQQAKRAGAKLICIDPRRSETAEKCDSHLPILPGTDAALALSIMHELIVNDWLDHEYLAQYTLGWPELKAHALSWSPERAAQICGIDASQIRDLANDYGTIQPAAIRLNYGVQRARGGGNAIRAVACLPALTGAWRHRAGGLLMSASGFKKLNSHAVQRPDLLAHRPTPLYNMSTIGDVLTQTDQIKALIVYNSNPLAVAPESAKVAQGFAREDLFTVVLEHFQTDTADYADIILPATTQLEHWDIHTSYGHTDVLLNQPAIAPVGQCRSNAQIFRDLARRMGFHDACFKDDDVTLCQQALQGTGIDWQSLLAQGWHSYDLPEAPFAHGQFPTPSGKCEFYSERLQVLGLDALPQYIENYETSTTDVRFPLQMISPPARNFLNSSFVNIETLQDKEKQPLIEMHENDALSRGLIDGQVVQVFNDRGTYECVVRINQRAREGVVVGLGIWWRKLGRNGTNVNELTHQRLTDMGRAPTFYDCAVQVKAVP